MIPVIDGFNINAPLPIDSRTLFATLSDRDNLNINQKFEGLTCFVIATNKHYYLDSSLNWQILATPPTPLYEAITYINFYDKLQNEQLVKGRQYVIIDYKTIYNQPESNELYEGDTEYIMLLATSEKTISKNAYSLMYPKDILTYDALNNICEDGVSARKGIITRRIDEFGNDCPYDHRAVMFRRWCPDLSNFDAVDNDTVYQLGNMCIYNNTLYYCKVTQTQSFSETALNPETDTDHFYKVISSTDYLFTKLAANPIGTDIINQDSIYIDANTADFQDFYTFYLEGDKVFLNTFKFKEYSLLNNVFTGYNINSNTFGNDISLNTFGNDIYSNSFGNNIYSNYFGNSIFYNSFGNDITLNTFGNNIYSNTFVNYIYSNSFGNNIYFNSFGNDITLNTFGNNIYSNSFGNNIYSNSFGNNIYSNSFGNYFQNNKVGNYFGIDPDGFFNSGNKIGDDCRYNIFGNYIWGNLIGNNFGYDGDQGAKPNTIGNLFTHNKIGNNCQDNIIGNECSNNVFGNYTNNNKIRENFAHNIVGNSFEGNVIPNNSEGNNFGNVFLNNNINLTALSNNDFCPMITNSILNNNLLSNQEVHTKIFRTGNTSFKLMYINTSNALIIENI